MSLSLFSIPFNMGIFPQNLLGKKEQKSHPTSYYKCYGIEAYYNGRTTYQYYANIHM